MNTIETITTILFGLFAITMIVLSIVMIKSFLIPDIKYSMKRKTEKAKREKATKERENRKRIEWTEEIEKAKANGLKDYYGFTK